MAEISPNWNALYSNQGIRLQGNPVLDNLRQQYAQRQQQQQQENNNFTSQIAKLNFGGARDADADYLHKQFGDVTKTFGQLRNTTNPEERAALQLQLQQKMNGFAYDAEKSKQANQDYMKKAALAHSPTHHVTPEYYKDMQEGQKISTFSPEYPSWLNRGDNWFAPQWDALKESSAIFKVGTNKGQPTIEAHVDPNTGQRVQRTITAPVFNKDEAINGYINRAINSPDAIREAEATTGLQGIDALHKRATDLAELYAKGLSPVYSPEKNMGLTMDARRKISNMTANREIEVAKTKQRLGLGYTANQPTAFQVAATPLQHALQTNPEVGKVQFDKEILPHLPTKGLKQPITTSIDNGQLVIHIPRKKTGITASQAPKEIMIPIDDPNFGSILQTKMQQEGMNISDFNQSYKGSKVKTPNTHDVKVIPPKEKLY